MITGSRRRRIARVVGAVLVLVGVVWLVVDDDVDGAEDVVRAYAELIEKGDASAANATVDPRRFESIDPALLTDDVLGLATEHIEVTDVSVGPHPYVEDDGKVSVQVRYRLAGEAHSTTVVAQRDGGVLGFGRRWRVVTPLTAAVEAAYNRPGVGRTRLGSAEIPVGTFPAADRSTHVYPGVYPLTAVASTYFTAEDVTVPLVADSEPPIPVDTPDAVGFEYLPNARLRTEAGKIALDLLDACLADSPDVAEDACPYPTKSDATDVRLTAKPAVSLDDLQFEDRREPGDITNPIFVVVGFPVAYTDSDGERRTEQRSFQGLVHITGDATLRVDFDSP
jgi:hypothetical protein